MKIFKITLSCTTDFNTSGGSQGSTVDILKDEKGFAYIPGSHIKGVMRTEAERMIRTVKGINCWITGDADKEKVDEDKNKRGVVLCEGLKVRGEYECEVCPLFGVPNNDGTALYQEGKLKIMDFRIVDNPVSVARMHVSIKRDYLSRQDGGLFRTKAIPSGSKFSGYFILKDLSEAEERLLWASLHSMCDYGLGGGRSRGLGCFELSRAEEIAFEDFVQEGVHQ